MSPLQTFATCMLYLSPYDPVSAIKPRPRGILLHVADTCRLPCDIAVCLGGRFNPSLHQGVPVTGINVLIHGAPKSMPLVADISKLPGISVKGNYIFKYFFYLFLSNLGKNIIVVLSLKVSSEIILEDNSYY